MKLPPAGPSELSPRGSSGSAGKAEGNFEISVRHTDLVTHRTQSRHSDLFELEVFCHFCFPLSHLICQDSLVEMLQVEAPKLEVWTGGPDSWIYHEQTAPRNGRSGSLGYIAAPNACTVHFSKISGNTSTLASGRTQRWNHDVISAGLPYNATLNLWSQSQKMGFGPTRW